MNPPRLHCVGVGKAFGPVRALDGVDLTVGQGELVALVGPSGCGKSTLLGIVAGLDAPDEGEVVLEGRASYMFQKDLLLPWLRVIDNAALPLELVGVPRDEARRRAAAFFPRFGLDGFERSWPRQLSGGMRQRAALLRTYLVGRELLLLDEPFGALDALTRAAMQEWLLEIWSDDRPSVLFVTHDVEEALFLADRVYVMSARPGRIVAEVASPFPRPRDLSLTGDPGFARAKERLLALLRGEQLVAAG